MDGGFKMIKLKDILNEASTSESYQQMLNMMKNAIPMIFKKYYIRFIQMMRDQHMWHITRKGIKLEV